MTLTTDAQTHQGPTVAQPAVPNDGPGLDPAQNPPVAEIFGQAAGPVTGPTGSLASRVVNLDNIAWTPFPMPGTAFKLLNINETSGATTILLYVSEGAQAPLHRHLGAAEAYNIFGNWAYEGEAEPIGPNCYVYEPAGVVHLPKQENESLMFGIFHGPIVGYNDDGSVAGVITADLLWDLAAANDAIAHLPARVGR
ncbi:cupin domain-containing protein [Nocardia sp. NPDC051990]|uniref:cupin domain-containing protein n=1 Tax=Nocardia sp. NPDC051990 TaxID=3155285 RepID=UPI0034458A59